MESRHVCVSSNEMSSVSFGVLSFSLIKCSETVIFLEEGVGLS